MSGPPNDASQRRACFSQALKVLRRRRGLATTQVATALGMSLRSYQNFEAGRGRLNVLRVHEVARILDADPYALLIAIDIGSADFAVRCIDNKLAAILLMALNDFDEAAGDQIALLDPATLMSLFKRAFDTLAGEARDRAARARNWRGPNGPGRPPDLT